MVERVTNDCHDVESTPTARDPLVETADAESVRGADTVASATPQRRRKWSRTIVNFWLDGLLLVLFVLLTWITAVLRFVFPQRVDTTGWRLWGGDQVDWMHLQFICLCVFAAGVALHVMLHWSWVCGVINTSILRRRLIADDGSDTLIGVGLIAAILHVIGIGLLLAMWSMQSPTGPVNSY